MKTVYALPPKEDWICDRFVKEWTEDNSDITVASPKDADVVWLLSSWCWLGLAQAGLLTGKKVITTIHHITPEKFGPRERQDFDLRDTLTTVYHVYNERTLEFIRPMTHKNIHLIHYWANQKIWTPTTSTQTARMKYGIPCNAYVAGSFQRDTEGSDLSTPKLEKGPDLLADFIYKLKTLEGRTKELFVVLAGWRRQYIISRLEKMNVSFKYFDLPSQATLNELYQTLDIYPVTARHEGGPQSLIECGLLNVPVVSRPVGIAEQVLPSSAINNDVSLAIPAVPNVESWKLPYGYEQYRKLIEEI